jgi:hypothetical protein
MTNSYILPSIEGSLIKRDPYSVQGNYRGVLESIGFFWFTYISNIVFLDTIRKSTSDITAVPLASFLTSLIYYPVDTYIKHLQFQGFLNKNDLIKSPVQIINQLKQNGVLKLYSGSQYFFIKTILLSLFQIQMMNMSSK